MRKGSAKRLIAETRGVLHLPLAVTLISISLLGLGGWGVMRNWRKAVETQLRLDQCVGGIAMELKETLERIDADNNRIREIRAALVAGTLLPASVPPLRAALVAVVVHQEYLRGKWRINQALWLARRGCGNLRDRPGMLTELSFFREPPDSIGPRPLRWAAPPPSQGFRIEVRHPPRASAAKVFQKNGWVAEWAGFP